MSDPTTDAQLTQRLQSGDREAWDSLFTAYSEPVWRYVARLLGSDSAQVADVVQETFQAAMQSIRQFDLSRGSHWAWLAGIAHNRSMLYWRTRRIENTRLNPERILAESNGRLSHWFESSSAPSSVLEQSETATLVRQILADLPEDYAFCLMAKYVDDLSAAEIADQLGESVDAIRSRLTRAREAFRDKMRLAADGTTATRTGVEHLQKKPQ